jgi:hypothetical protein
METHLCNATPSVCLPPPPKCDVSEAGFLSVFRQEGRVPVLFQINSVNMHI